MRHTWLQGLCWDVSGDTLRFVQAGALQWGGLLSPVADGVLHRAC